MALWAVRAGKHGENETYGLENGLVSTGWEDLGDLSDCQDRDSIHSRIEQAYPDAKLATRRIWTGELWAMRDRIQVGDLVALPLKTRSAIAIGRITGPYRYDPNAPFDAKHQRSVKWIRTDLPRSEVDQDLLFSLGSVLAVFQVKRDEAEKRLLALAEGKATPAPRLQVDTAVISEETPIDLEEYTRDQITKFLGRNFRGHDLARLVAGVLQAQGYRVEVSPPGADGGVDIIAGQGPMGFDPPRIAVQVKSSDSPVDIGVLRELQGVMPQFGAQHGLIVAWGGFKDSVLKDARRHFFTIRLWDAGALVSALQDGYDRLSPELRAEIPLRRVWALTESE
jgi:restriction system protein